MTPRANMEWARNEARKTEREGGERLPILYPRDVEGEPDTLRLTVLAATGFRRNSKIRVEFREYPGRILWAVGRGLLNAVKQLDQDNFEEWAGRRLTLEKVKRHHRGREHIKYDFAPPEPMTESTLPEADPPKRKLRRRSK